MDIPPHELFFFKEKWSTELDDLLLATFVRVRQSYVRKALAYRNKPYSRHDRVQLLETRYQTFRAVVATPGVWWEPKMKVVVADDRVWLQIFKYHMCAVAYYPQDEAEFHRMAILFGPIDVKVESSEETKKVVEKEIVINIFDYDSPFSEEFNSPANLIC
ncbi:hypothetical protein AAHA92_30903 [Salvia divinorum]|uniref:Myb/SANT-like domain-containing protein n=1 Tax=Salvia divinorum TaxID=28513 RepID=A0ABD1FSD1_SALDI